MAPFNDLLIIQQIVPHLGKETLKSLLIPIRKANKTANKENNLKKTLCEITKLLSECSDDEPLLRDFLQCSVG